MTSIEIRKAFLDFFKSKQHQIVDSAPMIVKNDPTLMFTNAGMNQFKDIFLGNTPAEYKRVADSQKCLRVSGKHNDLEEVGHDTYHHTMFEMLGNWSFGDYFKKEAITWAWEFLTQVMKIDKNNLYVTVFGGDAADKTGKDMEAYNYWKEFIAEDRILFGNKKDNFWEMGESGPCGPCSEIHVDIRSDQEKAKSSGKDWVNKDHPQVIEIWNLVFMQFNRMANGQLVELPNKHVDTGMGFERLCMVLQGKQSNYDTDVFQPLIQALAKLSHRVYGQDPKADIAMRVIADHLRAVSFSIADGQLPSNNKAGYVIRRILRRAVRYGYTFLDLKEAFMYRLFPVLVEQMGEQFKELRAQQELIGKVIEEEENSFLHTLENGIRLLSNLMDKAKEQGNTQIVGSDVFTLYDTYGFPFDLTDLILREHGMNADISGFEKEMIAQKARSRNAATISSDDWVILQKGNESQFIGYDALEADVEILRYRKVNTKGKILYQLVFNQTPFYAESGGQLGDKGFIVSEEGEKFSILDTKKENNLIVHWVSNLPSELTGTFRALVNIDMRSQLESNHTATHLLHHALRAILGPHVEQKGSLVNEFSLRFDFSHFQKVSDEQIREIELLVNQYIRRNIPLQEFRNLPIDQARNMGATALFSEKYGDHVRVIKFSNSVEFCGGTHASATGNLGVFKIINESAVAAGIRRIEAVSGVGAEAYLTNAVDTLKEIRDILKTGPNILQGIKKMVGDYGNLKKEIDQHIKERVEQLQES
ncbi:MAG: alanine--tRNA ligase, partial [Bacteroidales bacterium]